MKTAVICAMRRELDAITAEMENVSVSRQRGFEIFTGELHGKRVAACLSGVGKAYAAAVTAVLIERFSPEIIINSGVAGGAPGLKKGERVVATGTHKTRPGLIVAPVNAAGKTPEKSAQTPSAKESGK